MDCGYLPDGWSTGELSKQSQPHDRETYSRGGDPAAYVPGIVSLLRSMKGMLEGITSAVFVWAKKARQAEGSRECAMLTLYAVPQTSLSGK